MDTKLIKETDMEDPEDLRQEPISMEGRPSEFQKKFGQLIIRTLSEKLSLPTEQIHLCEGRATKIDKDTIVFFLKTGRETHAVTAEIRDRFLTNLRVVDLKQPA